MVFGHYQYNKNNLARIQMKILVKVKTGKKEQKIKVIDKDHLEIELKSRPQEGKANKELIKLLAEHYRISQSQIFIAKGFKTKVKIVNIAVSS